jgi:hypothetical protein
VAVVIEGMLAAGATSCKGSESGVEVAVDVGDAVEAGAPR